MFLPKHSKSKTLACSLKLGLVTGCRRLIDGILTGGGIISSLLRFIDPISAESWRRNIVVWPVELRDTGLKIGFNKKNMEDVARSFGAIFALTYTNFFVRYFFKILIRSK